MRLPGCAVFWILREVSSASFFALPNFQTPRFNLEAILTIFPALLLVTSEHIGHQVVTGKIVGRDLLKEPGLNRSLFADFFSTTLLAVWFGADDHLRGEYRCHGSD